jgi:hypothetical protein
MATIINLLRGKAAKSGSKLDFDDPLVTRKVPDHELRLKDMVCISIFVFGPLNLNLHMEQVLEVLLNR